MLNPCLEFCDLRSSSKRTTRARRDTEIRIVKLPKDCCLAACGLPSTTSCVIKLTLLVSVFGPKKLVENFQTVLGEISTTYTSLQSLEEAMSCGLLN